MKAAKSNIGKGMWEMKCICTTVTWALCLYFLFLKNELCLLLQVLGNTKFLNLKSLPIQLSLSLSLLLIQAVRNSPVPQHPIRLQTKAATTEAPPF